MQTRLHVGLSAMLLVSLSCRDQTGPLSEPTLTPQPTVAAATALAFYQLSGGQDQYTCGVTLDYRAYCWGRNYRGQLGGKIRDCQD